MPLIVGNYTFFFLSKIRKSDFSFFGKEEIPLCGSMADVLQSKPADALFGARRKCKVAASLLS